jgi:hypothetical protein
VNVGVFGRWVIVFIYPANDSDAEIKIGTEWLVLSNFGDIITPTTLFPRLFPKSRIFVRDPWPHLLSTGKNSRVTFIDQAGITADFFSAFKDQGGVSRRGPIDPG